MAQDIATRLAVDARTRNAALALCKTDIAFIKEDLRERSIKERATDRVKEGAMDIADEAMDYTEQNPKKVAGGAAALVVLLAGKPMAEGIAWLFSSDRDEDCNCAE